MFDISKEEFLKKEAEHKAKSMFAEMMMDAIITSDSTPKDLKLRTQIMKQVHKIQDLLSDVLKKYIEPEKNPTVENLETVLTYLALVKSGLIQFLESTPLVEEETNGN